MNEVFERYSFEVGPRGSRITFDQRKHAVINVACGALLAGLGYIWSAPAATAIMWVGIVWALLAMLAFSDERVTEIGDVLVYRNGRKEKTLPRNEVVEVSIRVRREHGRRQRQPVLPWEVEIHAGGKRPFASYSFQNEAPARAFGVRLSGTLGAVLLDHTEGTGAAGSGAAGGGGAPEVIRKMSVEVDPLYQGNSTDSLQR